MSSNPALAGVDLSNKTEEELLGLMEKYPFPRIEDAAQMPHPQVIAAEKKQEDEVAPVQPLAQLAEPAQIAAQPEVQQQQQQPMLGFGQPINPANMQNMDPVQMMALIQQQQQLLAQQ